MYQLCNILYDRSDLVYTMQSPWGEGGGRGEVLSIIFGGFVPLASLNPYPVPDQWHLVI